MNYLEFFKKLKNADSRIEYCVLSESKKINDINMPEFYYYIDPINVEFEYNDGIVRIIPYNDMLSAKNEYHYIKEGCVFATCNGEPIYEKNGKVFTCICGKNKLLEEEFAESIICLFESVEDKL